VPPPVPPSITITIISATTTTTHGQARLRPRGMWEGGTLTRASCSLSVARRSAICFLWRFPSSSFFVRCNRIRLMASFS
jgi:hypothetical protein